MHLLIHIYHNDGLFNTALEFIKFLKLSPYGWLKLLFEEKMIGGVKELFEKYQQDTRQELWLNRDELVQNIQNPGVVDSYISGDLGYNLLFVHKAIAMSRFVPDLKKFAKLTLEKLLSENNLNSIKNLDFLNDALNYDACSISNIFENLEKTPTVDMKYDVQKLISEKNKKLEEFQFKKPTTISFTMNESQRDILTRSLELYGSTDLGVSRILTKVFVKKILRTGSIPDKSQKSDIQIKNAADWPYC
tara:strand:- start:327 stop:1067 length:741 start_codon:yes stop_codon:yes gene_type:complete